MSISRAPSMTVIVAALVVALELALESTALGQAQSPERYPTIDWPSKVPAGCPFEPSGDVVGIKFTGQHREYANADCWNPSWASDGNMYSCYSDGAVLNILPDGKHEKVHTIGNREASIKQLKVSDANNGAGKIVGDDPLNLTVTAATPLSTPAGPYHSRYPSGSLVYNGIWYYGTHPEGPGGVGPFTGFRISRDYGKTWEGGRNDPTKPLFPTSTPALDKNGKPTYVPVRIGEPFFVDFGKNMEHAPGGKAYLVAHGSTEPANGKDRHGSHWHAGDQAFLFRVTPSPENMNDESKYEFFAGHDGKGKPVWSSERSKMRPLIEWKGNVGPTTMTWNAPLRRYLFCITDGEAGEGQHGRFDTYILESRNITGPWKLVVYMKHFGEQGYFVNIPSKFISKDGRTAWICYAANFSKGSNNPKLEASPPGSRYAMNLHQIQLRAKK